MTRTFNILILSFAIVSYSCNNSDPKNKTHDLSFDTTTSAKDVKPTVISAKEIQIDSSKLLKAFSDIYFGIPESIEDKPDGGRYDALAGKIYTIGGHDFFIGVTDYSEQGLYKFDLNSKKRFDSYNDLLRAMDEVHNVTVLSYKTFNTISIATNDLQWYNDMWKLPIDNNETHYLREYNKGDLTLRLGYYITYKTDDDHINKEKRRYRITYTFFRPSVATKIKESQQQEEIKKGKKRRCNFDL